MIHSIIGDSDFLSKVTEVFKSSPISVPILIGGCIPFLTAFIDNLGKTALEEKISTNLTKFQDKLVISILFLVIFTSFLYIGLGDGYLLGAFISSILLLFLSWITSVLVLFFFIPRERYFFIKGDIEDEGVKVNWELVRYNKKHGYLFKRLVGSDKTVHCYKFFQLDDIHEFEGKIIPSRFTNLFRKMDFKKVKNLWEIMRLKIFSK